MINDLKNLEQTIETNKGLTFEEYQQIREPAVNVIINDYASRLIEEAERNGEKLSVTEARERAKIEIPANFVPEWMKNLRISANIAGTELCYLEQLHNDLSNISELLHVCFEPQISKYIKRHVKDFKRVEADKEEDNAATE